MFDLKYINLENKIVHAHKLFCPKCVADAICL